MNAGDNGLMNLSAIMWTAAILAVLMYGLSNLIARSLVDRRRDAAARMFRAVFFLATVMLMFLPALLLALHAPVNIIGIIPYCIFLALYCYGLGGKIGFFRGRQHFNELMGIGSSDTIEEIQDRLLESRMRHPSRTDVVKSIGDLAMSGKRDPAYAAVESPQLDDADAKR
ncbi:MAG: hypothetical protein LBJ46_06145 [Planctomycetota bacterium]|jgi:hypothetical protein|nr:hypothetical protein [Planctomycetota bacterium]